MRIPEYWTLTHDEVIRELHTTVAGLTSEEAVRRLREFGRNELHEARSFSRATVFWAQIRNPLVLLLIFAAGASALAGEWIDASIVLSIVLASVAISYSREYRAETAVDALRARVHTYTEALRDGAPAKIPVEEVVPGDVVLLSAGSLVPADALLLEAADCFAGEAVLTGESFPVAKMPGTTGADTPLSRRTNCVFLSTNIRSGSARCIVVATGKDTQFGGIAHRLAVRPGETEFERGSRRFGYLLTIAMLVLVFVVFVAHTFRGRPPVETLLFSIALAVGLSPELMPAILTVNLARAAETMAADGVLVRRLNAIENLGSMDVLCTDKTGTLTEGIIQLEGAYDEAGNSSPRVLEMAALNAALQTGLPNPLDEAILKARKPDKERYSKLAEIPFDFVRKRLSVIVRHGEEIRLISKGAFYHVLEACTSTAAGRDLDASVTQLLEDLFVGWSSRGIRVIALATKIVTQKASYERGDEREMEFAGFLTFLDRPKEGVSEAIQDLARLGVSIKVITGDNKLVTENLASLIGIEADHVMTGADLDNCHDEALGRMAEKTDLFVEVDPNQKERIILSLRKIGRVVGFLGDGVNDAPAMHAADTSLSVETAVDVARQSADFVLLERHLDVIRAGIEEGRKTFANTLKYILMTTSANLGNMVSMAAASLFLPFLPLTAGQILLNNFLSDIPAVGLAGDSVDAELVDHPRRWHIGFIGRFMVQFGLLSSAFDFLTFATLLGLFHASPATFRTAWFVESLLSEIAIALVVRTQRPFYKSRPCRMLLWSTLAVAALAYTIPFLSLGVVGFVPLTADVVGALTGITLLYVVLTELVKRRFYPKTSSQSVAARAVHSAVV